MFLIRVWFIIAGVLLLGQPPALAALYHRGCQNGVVYYYFSSRDPAPPGQESTPILLEVARIQEPSPHPHLPSASFQRPRCLVKMLTMLGFYFPPVLPPSAAGPQRLVCHNIPEPQFVVPDLWSKVPKYFQEPSGNRNYPVSPETALNLPQYTCKPRLWGKVRSVLVDSNALRYTLYCFPVARPFTFRDTWGDPRPWGRIHRAVDISAQEGTEVYAITAGVVQTLATSPSGGIMLMLQGQDGLGYGYMHLQGYADGIVAGTVVRAGDLIGYVGHTGTQNSADHLHLQVYPDHRFCNDSLINPYYFLVQLCHGIGVTDLNQPRLARVERSPRSEDLLKSRASPSPGIFPSREISPSSALRVKNQMDSDLPAYLVQKVRSADHQPNPQGIRQLRPQKW